MNPALRRGAFAVCHALAIWVLGAPLRAQDDCRSAQLSTHSLHYCVAGAGSPTIVLAAGAGLTSATWAPLVPELSELGTVVSFDRAGLGASEPGPAPRSATRIATELSELLRVAGLSGPYVLVGHSAGGLHVLRFAELRPAEVAGVLLLDTPPPGFEELRAELLSADERRARREAIESALRDAPRTVRLEREAALGERDGAGAPARLGAPLVIVVADAQDFGPWGDSDAHRRSWIDASRAFLGRSPSSRLVVASGAGHMVHLERPHLVVTLVGEFAGHR